MSIVELSVAKAHCRVVATNDDQLLARYLDAAEASAAEFLDRNLYASADALATARAAAATALQTAVDAAETARIAAEAITDPNVRDASVRAACDDKAAALMQFRRTMSGVVINPIIESAVLLSVGTLYENREDNVIGAGITVAVELPFGSRTLLQPLRKGLGSDVQAGKLRDVIALDIRVDTNVGGVKATTWQVFADQVPAAISPTSAHEMRASDAKQGETLSTIRIRWMPGVPTSGTMRARDLIDGTVYDLSPPIPDNKTRREWITFNASSGVNNG